MPGQVYPRGLYIAPWCGPDGELVLLAMQSNRRLAAPPLQIPHGADSVGMAEGLQRTLEEADPRLLKLV